MDTPQQARSFTNPRAGSPPRWLEVLVAVVALTYPVAYTYVYFVGMAGAPQIGQQVVYSGGKVLQFALPLLWMGWLWLRGAYRGGPSTRDTPEAPWTLGRSLTICLGFSLLTIFGLSLIGGLWLLPAGYLDVAGRAIRERIVQFGITTAWRYAGLSVFYAVVHSYLEEYYWRWFAFRQLRRLTPLAPAAIISGLAFAAHHVLVLGLFFGWASPLAWLAGGSVAVGGAFWAWLYERSGRLWIAWLSHMLIDIGVFGMGYWMILK